MTESPRVLIVLPTYEEAGNLGRLLPRLAAAVPDADVLVVDDNSPDGTAEVAERLGAELGIPLHVLRRARKTGLGDAYRAGFAWGLDRGYDLYVSMDSDLSHDPDTLPRLIERASQGADVVIGSRYVPGGATPDWAVWRRVLSRWGNSYVRFALGIRAHDSTTAFRVYRAAALKEIDIASSSAEGYAFLIEVTRRATQAGLSIAEVPIVFRDRTIGSSKMSTRIVAEAIAIVTKWGVGDRVQRFRRTAKASGAASGD